MSESGSRLRKGRSMGSLTNKTVKKTEGDGKEVKTKKVQRTSALEALQSSIAHASEGVRLELAGRTAEAAKSYRKSYDLLKGLVAVASSQPAGGADVAKQLQHRARQYRERAKLLGGAAAASASASAPVVQRTAARQEKAASRSKSGGDRTAAAATRRRRMKSTSYAVQEIEAAFADYSPDQFLAEPTKSASHGRARRDRRHRNSMFVTKVDGADRITLAIGLHQLVIPAQEKAAPPDADASANSSFESDNYESEELPVL